MFDYLCRTHKIKRPLALKPGALGGGKIGSTIKVLA